MSCADWMFQACTDCSTVYGFNTPHDSNNSQESFHGDPTEQESVVSGFNQAWGQILLAIHGLYDLYFGSPASRPKSINFERKLPRDDAGKIAKHALRGRYWQ